MLYLKDLINGSNTTIDSSNVITVDDVIKRKFQKQNKIVRGHLLNHMTNHLFDLFIINLSKKCRIVWNRNMVLMIQERNNMVSVS